MNSNHVFELETLPESISVIGGGYIGIELAQILHSFGVKTTLIIRSIPLRFVDREVVEVLVHQMK
jgi:pyruvate/2-oxoglutarate dehydrogenase complex dihydrolipoamide dehydrogenase (E3) component